MCEKWIFLSEPPQFDIIINIIIMILINGNLLVHSLTRILHHCAALFFHNLVVNGIFMALLMNQLFVNQFISMVKIEQSIKQS